MKKRVIIKHGMACTEIISYDDKKTNADSVVELWIKKQPEYLLRGERRSCVWSVSSKAGLVGAIVDSARV